MVTDPDKFSDKMRIERVNVNVARIYFVDDPGNEIPIPIGITLRDTLNNINETPLVIRGIESFFISWIANYSLFQNGVEICALKNQKQQSVEAVDGFIYSLIQQ
ncbi:23556_t:CDS:2 [Dentiscutata erythropus]|uniref:23556_t:CDS:1 n=1 Tax=Dentiscutata erythropus TaxID=1348616 RepID=A0A9N9CGZ5_9GLOM|nr:23556_t:CDS:2 [Dentiscutata erythropus]